MLGRQCDESDSLAEEDASLSTRERFELSVDYVANGRIELACGADLRTRQLLSRANAQPPVCRLSRLVVWDASADDQHGDQGGLGDELLQQSELFPANVISKSEPVMLPPGRFKLATSRSRPDRTD